MGQLRSACRALLLEHPSPAATLSALDRFAARLPGARCTTVFCAVLTPGTGELTYSCAGHPPPILVLADHTKVGVDSMVQTVPTGRIDVLVTDGDADPAELDRLRDAGVDVRVAIPGSVEPVGGAGAATAPGSSAS